jgi:hypothetical protein
MSNQRCIAQSSRSEQMILRGLQWQQTIGHSAEAKTWMPDGCTRASKRTGAGTLNIALFMYEILGFRNMTCIESVGGVRSHFEADTWCLGPQRDLSECNFKYGASR